VAAPPDVDSAAVDRIEFDVMSAFAETWADPRAFARVADLAFARGDVTLAQGYHGRALRAVLDAEVRRELVLSWFARIAQGPGEIQLDVCVHEAGLALELGDTEEAILWAERALELRPASEEAALLAGRARLSRGDVVSAEVLLSRLVAESPRADIVVEAQAELAEAMYLRGDFVRAREFVETVRGSLDRPSLVLRVDNTMGKILLAEAKYVEAEEHFVRDEVRATAAGDETAKWRARVNRGIALLYRGGLLESERLFREALAEGERTRSARLSAFALDNLAVVTMQMRHYPEALDLLERAVDVRMQLGDRLRTAVVIGNLAELRLRLGLVDHAEHILAFGRRLLGKNAPAGRTGQIGLLEARVAMAQGFVDEAYTLLEVAKRDLRLARETECLAEAALLEARIALEDGRAVAAQRLLDFADANGAEPDTRAAAVLLRARATRAEGAPYKHLALRALDLAEAACCDELCCEAHGLLYGLACVEGDEATQRECVIRASAVRDRVAGSLPEPVRGAYLKKPEFAWMMQGFVFDALPRDATAALRPSGLHKLVRRAVEPREHGIAGSHPKIRALLVAVGRVARSIGTVLVVGESGTGKELVAASVHKESDRRDGPWVTVNCAALAENLLLSELFGHEKGAFTGAVARHRGRFEVAEGGTLFLDEIGDISPRTQVALLRVLQEKTFERVGGTTQIRANVRVVCATHRDLRAMVERGEFREDLYYRLREITLEVPALRQRLEDLGEIVESILLRIAQERGEPRRYLTEDALALFRRYPWPGNVRELENVLSSVTLLEDDDELSARHFVEHVDELAELVAPSRASVPALSMSRPIAANENAADLSDAAYAQLKAGDVSLPSLKRRIERECISRALEETQGNITRAALLLGMKRPRLSQLVKHYEIGHSDSEDL
jgi:DNA-binding NtrC family response regulator/tetratricopeptide (TPR) repeat protein